MGTCLGLYGVLLGICLGLFGVLLFSLGFFGVLCFLGVPACVFLGFLWVLLSYFGYFMVVLGTDLMYFFLFWFAWDY